MEKLGKQVHFLHTTKNNSRMGEGSFVRLKTGRILFAYTNFYTENYRDFGVCNIAACYSDDEGETWSDSFVLLEKDENARCYYMSTFLRLDNGQIVMIILRKEALPGGTACMPMLLRSDDEGQTWSEMESTGLPPAYYVSVNDSVTLCKDGRILMPMSVADIGYTNKRIVTACSEDNGHTWSLLPMEFRSSYSGLDTFAEPGIFEHEDGSLWIYFRTAYGFQYHSVSEDGGKTWTHPEPNFRFPSAESPMRVKRVGDYVVAVSNPAIYSVTHPLMNLRKEGTEVARRTPLVCCFDKEDGKLFSRRGLLVRAPDIKPIVERTRYLEVDEADMYCYPAVFPVEDGFLVAYYHSNGEVRSLNSCKILKVTYEEVAASGIQ